MLRLRYCTTTPTTRQIIRRRDVNKNVSFLIIKISLKLNMSLSDSLDFITNEKSWKLAARGGWWQVSIVIWVLQFSLFSVKDFTIMCLTHSRNFPTINIMRFWLKWKIHNYESSTTVMDDYDLISPRWREFQFDVCRMSQKEVLFIILSWS